MTTGGNHQRERVVQADLAASPHAHAPLAENGAELTLCSYEHIAAILVRDHQIPRDRLGMEVALVELGIDSLHAVELLWTIEAQLGITLPAMPQMPHSLGDVVRLIDKIAAAQQVHFRPDDRSATASAPWDDGR